MIVALIFLDLVRISVLTNFLVLNVFSFGSVIRIYYCGVIHLRSHILDPSLELIFHWELHIFVPDLIRVNYAA